MDGGAWWAAVHEVAKSQTQLSDFTFTFHFHALETEMTTHSSVLAWRIPGTGQPGGLPSMGSHRVRHNWSDAAAAAAGSSEGKESSYNIGDLGLIHGLGRSSGERNGLKKFANESCVYILNDSIEMTHASLENPSDRGAWWAAVYGVSQSQTQLKQSSSSRKITYAL